MRQLFARVRASLGALVKQTRVQQFLLLAGLLAAMLASIYGAGWRARGTHDRAEAYNTARKHVVDTITIVKKELVHDSVLVRDTKVVMDTARKRFARSDLRIKIVGDTALSIDTGPPVMSVPAIQVIGETETAREMHHADSIAYHAVVTQLEHATKRGDLESRRADLAERALGENRGRQFGFSSGVAVGALLFAGAKLLFTKF